MRKSIFAEGARRMPVTLVEDAHQRLDARLTSTIRPRSLGPEKLWRSQSPRSWAFGRLKRVDWETSGRLQRLANSRHPSLRGSIVRLP